MQAHDCQGMKKWAIENNYLKNICFAGVEEEMKMFWNQIVLMAAQICKYTKKIVHL